MCVLAIGDNPVDGFQKSRIRAVSGAELARVSVERWPVRGETFGLGAERPRNGAVMPLAQRHGGVMADALIAGEEVVDLGLHNVAHAIQTASNAAQ